MLLRNKERFLEVLEVGVDRESDRRFLKDGEHDIPTHGFFFEHDGATYGLGVSRGAIFVLLRDQLTPYGPGFRTEMQEYGESRVFTASQDTLTLISITYCPAKPSWNIFTMEDDEDVDGFLWVHNVLSSAERRSIFIANNGG